MKFVGNLTYRLGFFNLFLTVIELFLTKQEIDQVSGNYGFFSLLKQAINMGQKYRQDCASI